MRRRGKNNRYSVGFVIGLFVLSIMIMPLSATGTETDKQIQAEDELVVTFTAEKGDLIIVWIAEYDDDLYLTVNFENPSGVQIHKSPVGDGYNSDTYTISTIADSTGTWKVVFESEWSFTDQTITYEIHVLKFGEHNRIQDERLDNIDTTNVEQDTKNAGQDIAIQDINNDINDIQTKNTNQDTSIGTIETKNSDQDNQIGLIKAKNTEQDDSITAIEAKNNDQDASRDQIVVDHDDDINNVNSQLGSNLNLIYVALILAIVGLLIGLIGMMSSNSKIKRQYDDLANQIAQIRTQPPQEPPIAHIPAHASPEPLPTPSVPKRPSPPLPTPSVPKRPSPPPGPVVKHCGNCGTKTETMFCPKCGTKV